jgi:L-gulonate 5-dehydrogenase
MKALILSAPQQLAIGTIADPVCGPHDVLLRPLATGICAGDQYLYAGRSPYAKYPLIGGHEICGLVARTGESVTRVKVGDRAVIEPVVGCGHCYSCRHGRPNCCMNFCLIGLHRPGGFAEQVVAPEQNVHRIPAGLDPVLASFAEPLTIGLHACRRAAVESAEYVLILGAGPIGLAVLECAKLRGARVVVSDLNPDRLAVAAKLGAETILAGAELLPTILGQTGNAGADVVIEATGAPAAIESTIDLVAPGGRIVIVGLVKKGTNVSFPGLDFTRKEVNLLGSRNSTNAFPEAIALLAAGAIHYPAVATKFSLWEGPEVFARLHANPAYLHKGVLTLD